MSDFGFKRYRIKIHFAHRTFSWRNEAKGNAAVHVVIVGFAAFDAKHKFIFEYEDIKGEAHAVAVKNINPYLVDLSDILITNKRSPLCNIQPMIKGNEATDNGFLILNKQEKEELINQYEIASPWVRPFMGGENFIKGTKRWCLWLKDAAPQQIKKSPFVMERILAVKTFREASAKLATVAKAQTPSVFGEIRQARSGYSIIIPKVSSERRKYVPIGFVDSYIILNNTVQFIPDGSLYVFGVLQSSMHITWLSAVGGRLESRYQYSIGLVYNNYPWPPSPSDKHT